MQILIDKGSEVPVRKQLSEQIVFLIATGALKAGDPLPSVREMARRHEIHANTASEAYQDLVQRHWLKGHRGKKMVVRPFDDLNRAVGDLDDVIDDTIRTALERGYTLQQLRKRLRERLLITPPDHVLIVEEEPGMRRLLQEEFISEKDSKNFSGVDLVFCDTSARHSIRARQLVPYHVVSNTTAQKISDRISSAKD